MNDAEIKKLARNLAAAYIAWQLGYNSVDYVLRKKIPRRLPAHWISFAREVDSRMNPQSNPTQVN